MTKISETVTIDQNEKKLVVKETHDFRPVAEKAKALKSAGLDGLGKENKLVGLIPMKMWYMWAKKWGVDPADREAMKEVVVKEMNNPDSAQFRVWQGRL